MIDNPPAESYLSRFINWKTENSIISMTLQLSENYHQLFLSKNNTLSSLDINTLPSVSVNIVDKNKKEEITNYIARQSITMKQTKENELEKELEKLYVPMLENTLKIPRLQAQSIFYEIMNYPAAS